MFEYLKNEQKLLVTMNKEKWRRTAKTKGRNHKCILDEERRRKKEAMGCSSYNGEEGMQNETRVKGWKDEKSHFSIDEREIKLKMKCVRVT